MKDMSDASSFNCEGAASYSTICTTERVISIFMKLSKVRLEKSCLEATVLPTDMPFAVSYSLRNSTSTVGYSLLFRCLFRTAGRLVLESGA